MKRTASVLLIAVSVAAMVLASVSCSAQIATAPVTDENGAIVAENDVVKAVWRYEPGAKEDAGGGSLYELYYKPGDPSLNLVSVFDWGRKPDATALWIGVGGSGSTDLYAMNRLPSDEEWQALEDTAGHKFRPLIADNNLSGDLVSHSVSSDGDNNILVSFKYRVKSQDDSELFRPAGKTDPDYPYWYEVDKSWELQPSGRVSLDVKWHILADGWFSEPSIRFAWAKEGGWDRWVKYGSDWGGQEKYLAGSDGLISKYIQNDKNKLVNETWGYTNSFATDWYALAGSQSAPSIRVSASQGYRDDQPEPGAGFVNSFEQGVGKQFLNNQAKTIAEYGGCWMAWWGGNPPPLSRYHRLEKGLRWTDSFQIDFVNSEGELLRGGDGGRLGPEISGVDVSTESGTTTITWDTDLAADSAVDVYSQGVWSQPFLDGAPVTRHSASIQLPAGQRIVYRVKSRTDSKLAVSYGVIQPDA